MLSATGVELLERIGIEALREVILDVLCGVNLRDSTEVLTRRRIAFLSAATLAMFLRAQAQIPDFEQHLATIAATGLASRPPKQDRWILLWMLGLTEKAFQNVLRDSNESLLDYAERYQSVVEEVAAELDAEWGRLSGNLLLTRVEMQASWLWALHLATSLGSQALAIRGSEKSMYGKLFEPLILGSMLHLLGFRFLSQDRLRASDEYVYWLASKDERRESDATLLIRGGQGVRFDIGFIGRGNPEITLDKVSRFERQVEFNSGRWFLATFVVVDTIPAHCRLPELAAEIDGTVIQMSMSFWPREVADELARRFGFESPIRSIPEVELRDYITAKLETAPIHTFLRIAENAAVDQEGKSEG